MICIDDKSTIDCLVRDLSNGGADSQSDHAMQFGNLYDALESNLTRDLPRLA